MPTLSPRVRSFLDDYLAVLVVGLLLVTLAGGYVAYGAHATEETRTETRTTGNWTVESRFDHAATVQRDAGVFATGDRLENRSLYFTSLAPELDGTYRVTHRGTDGEPAVAAVELKVVRRAVESIDGEPVVHWRETESLGSAERTVLPDDEPLTVPFTVNVTAQEQRIAEIESELGASPGTTEIRIVADVTLQSTLDGEPVTDDRTEHLELESGGGAYRVATDVADPTTREATKTAQVPIEPSPLSAYGAPLLALLALLGAAGLVVLGHTGQLELSAAERARLAYDRDREEYDEWISPGTVTADDRTLARVESLEALVDVAIDSNRRVIEVDDGAQYVAIADDVRYVFEPPDTRRERHP